MSSQVLLDPSLEHNYSPWLPADRSAAILDLGCGDGRVLRFLSSKGYCNVLGVDRDACSLASVGDLAGVSVEVTDVDANYLQLWRGRFRLIILRQMIYYIDRGDILNFMAALKNALDDDGVIIVEFFNAALLSSRMTELKDPFIRTAYTEQAIQRLFTATGLHTRHVGAERRSICGLRSLVYAALRASWITLLKVIYILERGIDNELPRIYTKSIIAVACKQVAEPGCPDRLGMGS